MGPDRVLRERAVFATDEPPMARVHPAGPLVAPALLICPVVGTSIRAHWLLGVPFALFK